MEIGLSAALVTKTRTRVLWRTINCCTIYFKYVNTAEKNKQLQEGDQFDHHLLLAQGVTRRCPRWSPEELPLHMFHQQ